MVEKKKNATEAAPETGNKDSAKKQTHTTVKALFRSGREN